MFLKKERLKNNKLLKHTMVKEKKGFTLYEVKTRKKPTWF